MMLLDEYSLIWKQIRPLVLMGLKLNYVNPLSLNWKESLQGCLITSWLLEWAHLGNSQSYGIYQNSRVQASLKAFGQLR